MIMMFQMIMIMKTNLMLQIMTSVGVGMRLTSVVVDLTGWGNRLEAAGWGNRVEAAAPALDEERACIHACSQEWRKEGRKEGIIVLSCPGHRHHPRLGPVLILALVMYVL